MAETTSADQKKPGRKAETPAQRLARLEQDLLLAKQAVQAAEERKYLTIGKAVMSEAADNPEFRIQLAALLRTRVTTKVGKAEIASLLDAPSPAD